jgi:formyltetrahydrofolate-dependent phosphoribosylglycinamide formyltransferase
MSNSEPVNSGPPLQLPFPPITARPFRLGVLISGGGTTLMNFLEEIQSGRLDAEVVQVIASQRTCRGVERARAAGLNVEVIRPRDFPDVEAFSAAVFSQLRAAGCEVVALAGFLSLLRIPDDFQWRVVNIHPSLIPAFCGHGMYGHHVHEAAVARGVKVSGCTVHFADNEYDHGAIILQRPVAVPDGTTPEALAALVFAEECKAYPDALQKLAHGEVLIDGRQTCLRTAADMNPGQ